MLSSSGQIFSAAFYVFEMLIFGKLMKRRSSRYIGLPTFLLLFFLCVQSSKSWLNSDVTYLLIGYPVRAEKY